MPADRPKADASSTKWPADAHDLSDTERRRQQVEALDVLRARLSYERIAELAGVTTLAVRGWYDGALAHPSRFRKLMELARNAHGFLPLEFVARTKAIDLRALTRPTREELLRRDWLLKIAGMETPGKRAEALSRLIAGVMLGRPEFAAAIGVGNRTLAKYLDPNWSGRISLPVLEKILGLPARQTRIAETSSLQQRLDKALLTLLGRKLHKARFTLPRGLKGAVVTKLAGLTEFSERSIYRNVFSPNPPSRAFVEKLEAVAETHGKLKFEA